ncbi:MAG: hypothetical protein CR954_00745 [Candidatus Moraniibacteriota bacterium]|nr:MAG: hypothetical protein CR954_00745 [Candidatus Moranbacteria bacterium]
MKSFFVFCVGVLSFFYLFNPTSGVFEFIPDVLPVVGNIDEATATALLLSSLAYFGIDLGHLFKRTPAHKNNHTTKKIADAEIVE